MIKFMEFIINDFDELTDFEKSMVFHLFYIKFKIYKKELSDKI